MKSGMVDLPCGDQKSYLRVLVYGINNDNTADPSKEDERNNGEKHVWERWIQKKNCILKGNNKQFY